MAMRKKLLYICAALWLVALLQMIWNYEEQKEPDIITAFSNDMFLETVSTVKSTAFYGNVYMEDEEKEKVVRETAERLGIKEPFDITHEESESGTRVTLVKNVAAVRTSISMVTVETHVSKIVMSQKQYLQINMEIDNSLDSAVYYRGIIGDIYTGMDLSADIYLYLRGDIAGDISYSEKNSIADHIVENLAGKVVTEKRGSDIFTIYAYTDSIDDYVVYGSTKTNINVVISYNDATGMTEVYMATPILNEDY